VVGLDLGLILKGEEENSGYSLDQLIEGNPLDCVNPRG